jgi:hypothetical protein
VSVVDMEHVARTNPNAYVMESTKRFVFMLYIVGDRRMNERGALVE